VIQRLKNKLKRRKGEMALSAVVIRKDGKKEDIGVISRSKIEFKTRGGAGG
jgi:hypothetical protein